MNHENQSQPDDRLSRLPPVVLTSEETVRLLKLDGLAAPEKALQRCIDRGLRPAMYAKSRHFTMNEIQRFLDQQTERYST